MTIPHGVQEVARTVADTVRQMIPRWRHTLSADEQNLAAHLRGNQALYDSLRKIIINRIEGRAKVPEPSNPNDCKSLVARDRELQSLLIHLEFIFRSPVNPAHDGEPPG